MDIREITKAIATPLLLTGAIVLWTAIVAGGSALLPHETGAEYQENLP